LFNRINENKTWTIHQPPSLTERGRAFLEKIDNPDPMEKE